MTHPSYPLQLAEGGPARVLETDGDRATVESSRPFPPGSTLVATAELDGQEICVKVRTCIRVGEAFHVKGRFVSLSKARRQALLSAFESDPPD